MVLDDVGDPHATFAALWQHFARPSSWRLSGEASAVISDLEQRGIRWGLASNLDERLVAICAGHKHLDSAHDLFISSQIGWRKPSPKFFQAVERRLALSGDSLLLIGDDLENDYRAARAAGWQALWLGNGQGVPPEHCLARLSDLVL